MISMREMIVPKSFEVQRTNANMLPGANDRIAPPLIENLFLGRAAEADPVLDALLKPQKFDMGEIAHAVASFAEKLPSQKACRVQGESRLTAILRAARREIAGKRPKQIELLTLRGGSSH